MKIDISEPTPFGAASFQDMLYAGFISKILHMRRKLAGRDDTILTALRFRSFEEFYQEFSTQLSWAMFSTDDLKIGATVKLYVVLQIRHALSITPDNDEHWDSIEQAIQDEIRANLEDIKRILNLLYPTIVEELLTPPVWAKSLSVDG